MFIKSGMFTYTVKAKDITIKFLDITVNSGKEQYVLILASPEGKFDSFGPHFSRIISSFKAAKA